ncbi:hypothetical protein PS467_08635 [Streptomyces luomodiensis]|uniref:GNAT-like C-terminal domain-containing protein n=1 Tax=Streptomyces luomodiensis TaxID=3026192 RepID=A0ABY9V992_9ACTN|nr:hypothetical protein [Streptomyces sp. SCA4-21]WNF01481.1 hypothetical protein PS467_08635 [Streptomyces sp. SCA4-21]
MRHFRGPLHRLAPLQFERTSPAAAALGGRPGPEGPAGGERVLGVPIAADGPLPQAGCDASLRAARDFLTRHFPDGPCRFATYSSWLLAPGGPARRVPAARGDEKRGLLASRAVRQS